MVKDDMCKKGATNDAERRPRTRARRSCRNPRMGATSHPSPVHACYVKRREKSPQSGPKKGRSWKVVQDNRLATPV